MLKAFSKIQLLEPYKFDIVRRCKRFDVPVIRKGNGWAIEEKYVPVILYKYKFHDLYDKIYYWSYDFDEGLQEAIYREMFEMEYEDIMKFLIRKDLI